MPIYTYAGNIDPNEQTQRLVRASGQIVEINQYADFTPDEIASLSPRYKLIPGMYGAPAAPVRKSGVSFFELEDTPGSLAEGEMVVGDGDGGLKPATPLYTDSPGFTQALAAKANQSFADALNTAKADKTALALKADQSALVAVDAATVKNSALTPAIQSELANNATVRTAAASAAQTAVQGLNVLTTADTEVAGDEVAFTIADTGGLRSWLEINQNGKPTLNAAALIAAAIQGQVDARVTLQNPISDLPAVSMEDYSFALVDSAGKIAELALDQNGRVPQWVLDAFRARMGIDSALPQSADQSITGLAFALVDQAGNLSELAIGDDGRFAPWVVDALKSRMGITAALAQIPPAVTYVTKTVKPDGTGDYTDIAAAVAAIIDSSATKQYELVIYPGVYTARVVGKPYISFRGTRRELCRLDFAQADNETTTNIANNSAMDLHWTTTVKNLTVTVKNGRYAVHHEQGGNNPDVTQNVENCYFEHYGNQGARDWRDANPGNPVGLSSEVWTAEHAWGIGNASGVIQTFEQTHFVSPRSGFYLHTNKDFTKPSKATLRRCRVTANNENEGMVIGSLGSGHNDQIVLEGCELDVLYISHGAGPWISPNQLTSDKAEHRITLVDCTPVGYLPPNRGKGLRIDSASTGTTSTVRVSGTAANAIWGNGRYRDGGGGLKGYGFGDYDIEGLGSGYSAEIAVANTLGKRLGDCSTTPKTLTVTFESGTTVNVVFNTDLTNATNASIISTINTALGANGIASEYVPALEHYPAVLDKERRLVNADTVGIARGQAVVYANATRRRIRLCTTSDPASALVGVALEAIPPGKSGRILTHGILATSALTSISQIAGLAGGIVAGTPVYLSDTTNGQFATSGTRQIGQGAYAGWVYYRAQGVL